MLTSLATLLREEGARDVNNIWVTVVTISKMNFIENLIFKCTILKTIKSCVFDAKDKAV